METREHVLGKEQGYSVRIPDATPSGQSVKVTTAAREGMHRMHAQSSDQSELYFEVVAYAGLLDHIKLAEEQQAFLRARCTDAELSEIGPRIMARHAGTSFDFRGTLQGRWKERRFLFVDSEVGTYRIVYDPTSGLNEQILAALRFSD